MTETRLPAQDDVLHLRVLRMAVKLVDPKSWAWNEVCSSFWRLYYNDVDGAEVEVEGKRYPIRAGRVYLIPPGVTFSCICHRPVDHLFFHFDIVSMPNGLVRDVFSPVIELSSDAGVEASLMQVRSSLKTRSLETIAELCRVKAALYQALSVLFRDLAPGQLARCMRVVHATNPVTGALYSIEDNLSAAMDNRVLARACGLSESHFIRTFRAVMGQTPAQYILDRRVALASQRLLYTRDSIEQIAETCGFPNRSYFTRVFTRRMGTPPATYRRKGVVGDEQQAAQPAEKSGPTASPAAQKSTINAA
jgi:AraC-like DNA-binding protein